MFGRRDIPVSILIFLGSWLNFGQPFIVGFLFGADCLGSAQAAFFAETQLCMSAFLKADLLADMPLSLVW